MPLKLGLTAQNLLISPTLAINELIAKKNKLEKSKILHMGFGESLLPLHPSLKKALEEAATLTYYAPVGGLLELRQAIAAYITRTRDISCSVEQVIVGPGSKALLYALFHVLEGDLLLPTPSWVSYAPIARLNGKQIVAVQTDPLDHHRLTPQALSRAVKQARENGQRPGFLIVNSPGNPTGEMFAARDIKAIAKWARENNIALISDEIYAELAHGWRKHISPFQFYPEGCIITGGLSKTFSAGGWRLGYAILPQSEVGEKMMSAIHALGSEVWSAAATPIQKAAVVAFVPDASMERYIKASSVVFGYVTGKLYETFKKVGVPCPRPAGGFYLYPDLSPWRSVLLQRGVKTSQELAKFLLEEWGIATLPGSAFTEDPFALCLRLSTSALCEPGGNLSQKEREEALWNILDQASKKQFTFSFPVLAHAQEQWTKVILSLQRDMKKQ